MGGGLDREKQKQNQEPQKIPSFFQQLTSNKDQLTLAAHCCFRGNLVRSVGEGTYTKTMSPLLEYAGIALAMVEKP